jgi:hypothetical protein
VEIPIPAEGEPEQWIAARMHRTTRREWRRLRARGYVVSVEAPGDFLPAFMDLHRERCAEWGTRPIAAPALKAILDSGPHWHAFVVRDADGRFFGAHLTVDLGDELFAWVGTTYRIQGGSLATLLIGHELQWCQERGRRGLNIGTSSGMPGVSDYKRSLGAVERPRWIIRWRRGRGYR